MIEKLRRHLFWPGMVTQIRSFVSQCSICKSTKSPNKVLRPPMVRPTTSDRPFQRLYMDLLGPYPRSKKRNIGLLIIVDHCTKFHFLQPLRKFTSERICEFLEKHVFYTFGTPESILTDNGSGYFRAFLTKFGVRHNASERVNRSILAAVRAYVSADRVFKI